MTRRPFFFAALVALAAAEPPDALAQASQSDLRQAVEGISPVDFAARVGVIAHDSMLGRDTPSRGLDMTARWIAGEFRDFGLEPAGDRGGFLQHYPIPMSALDFAGSRVRVSGGHALEFGTDVLPSDLGRPSPAEARGSVVVVSGSSDAERVRSEDVQGRVVILLMPARSELEPRDAVRSLTRLGAVGVLVPSPVTGAAWERRAEERADRRVLARGRRGAGAPVLDVRRSALAELLAGAGADLDALESGASGPLRATPIPLTLEIGVSMRPVEASAPNVVGVLRGSDPVLRDEYVVFSGHMDHVGVGTPDENGDSIFNGADDDASGTVAVIEIAQAMAALEKPPARSMMFLLVSGEEKGLWGSAYFADHTPVPVESIVANLNTDMVGRNWPDTIVAIGREHSDLGATLERVNRAHPELGMTAIDDLWPEQRFYSRSDHYNFARKGVPILFFFNGTHEDYHGRDDEPERIDAEKASRIARLVFYLGLEVGNAAERPAWDPESYRTIVEGAGGRGR